MSRPLNEIIAHIRAVSGNPSVKTSLIQTSDLEVLCNAAENNRAAMMGDILNCDADQDQKKVARHILRNTFVPPATGNDP